MTRGQRRVVAIFTDTCASKPADQRAAIKEAQRLAALHVFGRLKKKEPAPEA